MDIEVFGQLLPGQPRRRTLNVSEPTTAREVAIKIGLDLKQIGLVTINGVQSGLDDSVQTDSRLCFFPFIDGG